MLNKPIRSPILASTDPEKIVPVVHPPRVPGAVHPVLDLHAALFVGVWTISVRLDALHAVSTESALLVMQGTANGVGAAARAPVVAARRLS